MPRNNAPRLSRSSQQQQPISQSADAARTAPAETASHSPSHSPSYDEIAEAAYHRYLRRGGADGGDFDDWVEAERELRSRRLN